MQRHIPKNQNPLLHRRVSIKIYIIPLTSLNEYEEVYCGENVVKITPRENELHAHRMGKSLGGCQSQSGRGGKEVSAPVANQTAVLRFCLVGVE
jgi:hypothetical protein